MQMMKFAAGLAVGYLLGSRAGRDSYERIVVVAGRVRDHPVVAEAQAATRDLVSAGTDTLTAKRTALAGGR